MFVVVVKKIVVVVVVVLVPFPFSSFETLLSDRLQTITSVLLFLIGFEKSF